MKYIIRLDDICHSMDWGKFGKIKKIFIKHNVAPVLGIIPDNKDPKLIKNININLSSIDEFRNEIDQLIKKKWEIAQHGHTHELTQGGGALALHKQGEFPGLPEFKQMEKIKAGKEILEEWGWKIDYFFPPAHAFDATTLKVLRELKFKALLDGIGFYPWDNKGLKFIPQIWWRPSQIPQPFRTLKGTILICLHPNTMQDKDFMNLDMFLSSHKNTITSVKKTLKNFNGNPTKVSKALNKAAKLMFYTIKGKK